MGFMRSHHGMRPQDIVVLLKLVVWHERPWKQSEVAQALFLSQTEISESLNRSTFAGLLFSDKRRPKKVALSELLIHGVRYVFPVVPGPMVRGLRTAHSAPPLAELLTESSDLFVWPYEDGDCRGQAITPLYPAVPQAALRDRELYELLALVDALRVGRAREQGLAREELTRRFKEARHP